MPDVITDFDFAITPVVSDPLFRRWGGVMLTSALLGRHVWTSVRAGQPLFPHTFVMLVAGSGYGKSTTIGAVRECLRDYTRAGPGPTDPPRVRMAAKQITFPRLVRELGNAFPNVPRALGGALLRARCYALLADEIGVLMGEKAKVDDLQILAAIYDMDRDYDKQTVRDERDKRETHARDHYMVAMLGAQPAWIAEALPLGRFQLGLPARTHFVLGTHRTVPAYAQGVATDWGDGLRAALAPAMSGVVALSGLFTWEQAAWGEFMAWTGGGMPSAGGALRPWDGLLEGYGNRRVEHAAKLALVFAASRGSGVVEVADWAAALRLMFDTERHLDDILALVGANPSRVREDEVVNWVRAQGAEVPEAVLRAHMRAFFDTRQIGWVLDELERAGLLQDTARRASPHRRFVCP